MNNSFIAFSWPVVTYLCLTGFACGACLAALFFMNKPAKQDLVKRSLWASVLSLTLGGAFLLGDLDAVDKVLHIFTGFNTASAIAWGARLIILFVMLCTFTALLYKKDDRTSVGPVLKSLLLIFALAVGAYPAFVLLQVTARPLWNNYLLIPLFLLSASHSGFSLVQLLSPGQWSEDHRAIRKLDLAFIASQVLLIVLLLTTSSLSSTGLETLLRGKFSILFWFGLVAFGWLAPLVSSLGTGNKNLLILRQLCFLWAAFALKAFIIIGGQDATTFFGV